MSLLSKMKNRNITIQNKEVCVVVFWTSLGVQLNNVAYIFIIVRSEEENYVAICSWY